MNTARCNPAAAIAISLGSTCRALCCRMRRALSAAHTTPPVGIFPSIILLHVIVGSSSLPLSIYPRMRETGGIRLDMEAGRKTEAEDDKRYEIWSSLIEGGISEDMEYGGRALQIQWDLSLDRNKYILFIVIMTLELVAQVVRPDSSVINVGIQYSGVRFECHYCAGFCFVGKYSDWEHREIASKISWWPTGQLNMFDSSVILTLENLWYCLHRDIVCTIYDISGTFILRTYR